MQLIITSKVYQAAVLTLDGRHGASLFFIDADANALGSWGWYSWVDAIYVSV